MKPADLLLSVLHFALQSIFATLSLDPNRSIEDIKAEHEAAAAMLSELAPKTAIQASFATRAVIMYHASIECFRKAATPGLNIALKARFIGHANALSRQSAQMMRLLAQEKRANAPASVSSGITEMLVRAGEVVRKRQADAAANGAAAETVRQNPMPSEKVLARATAPAAAKQTSARPSAPAALPELTAEEMMDLADREMAKTKALFAEAMKAMAG